MSSIVANATPLIYLVKIGKINLLKRIFGMVLIPEEVKIETVDEGKRLGESDAYIIEDAINDGWLKVLNTKIIKFPVKLEKGEMAVLSLAKNLGVREVLIDEISARTVARLLGLIPRGTIYVLLKALEIKEIDFNEFLESLNELVKQGFRLKEEIYLEAIRIARRILKV